MKSIFKVFVSLIILFIIITPVSAEEFYRVNVGYQGYEDGTWLDFAYGGALAGTEGGDALDSLEVHLVDAPYGAQIEYRVYTVSGWTEWVSSFSSASNSDQDILGLQIRLKDFPNANVYYQSYRKDLGWGTWVSNGKTSGTLNASNPITGFRVKVDEIGVSYQSSVGGVNQILRHNGETQGKGSSLIETVSMTLNSAEADDKIEYRVYLRNEGWTNWAANGVVVGSTGKVVEALEARLVGLPQYSVQIQAQVNGEWWGYSYDGQTAGSIGNNQALTGYRVEIVQKVYVAPNTTAAPVVAETSSGTLGISTSNNLAEIVSVSGWAFPAMGDLNGDGLMDVVVGSFDGSVQTYYQTDTLVDGIVQFVHQQEDSNPLAIVDELGLSAAFPSLGDFDNDGDLDLVVGESSNNSWLYLYENVGKANNPQFELVLDNSDDPLNYLNVNRGDYTFVASGDIDGDGDDDLVLGSANLVDRTDYLVVYINNGGNNILTSLKIAESSPITLVADQAINYERNLIPYLGDFNGDNVIDFAYSGYMYLPIQLYLGTVVESGIIFEYDSSNNDESSPFYGIEYSVPFAAAGDIDNDGDADFIIGDGSYDIGTVRYYENN